MSSDSLSDAQQPARHSGTRRVGFQHPISTFQKASHSTDTSVELPLPLEAAKSVSAGHITTLHIGLQSFLSSHTQSCLTAYSAYHHHNVKTKDLILHPHRIPPSVKNLKLILQPLEELKESEGYKALQSDLNCEMEQLHRKLVEKYINPLNSMNTDAHLKRVHLAICTLLRNASKAFIAQLNLTNYSADEAIIDLLATSPHDLLAFPLPTDSASFLTLYKEANEDLMQLPFPTEKNNTELNNIIMRINSGQTRTTTTSTERETQLSTERETQLSHSNIIRVNRDGQSPSSSVTTNSQTGDPPQLADSNTALPTSSTTPPTNNNNISPQGLEHAVTAVTPGTILPPSRDIQSPYIRRTNQQFVTPGTTGTSVNTEVTMPLPSIPEAGSTHPTGHPPSFTGIQGTTFIQASSVLATQLAKTLLDNLDKSYSPITQTENTPTHTSTPPDPCASPNHNFSSQPEFSELDLESITITTKKYELLLMLRKLYKHTVQLPIEEFHSTVKAREELQRIRHITTPILQNNLSARVATKIQSERPADRPVLTGLIREESEKSTASLRQQLKSTSDKLEQILRQQAQQRTRDTTHQSKQPRTSQGSKNSRGGNMKKNKGRTGRRETSTVVAESSVSIPTSSTTPPPSSALSQQWGRKRPYVGPSKTQEQNSATAADNDSSAHTRRKSTHWKRPRHEQNNPK